MSRDEIFDELKSNKDIISRHAEGALSHEKILVYYYEIHFI